MDGSSVEERAKRAAARRAVDSFVRPGMCVGLGTGSTTRYAIEHIGEIVAQGTPLRAVATSLQTERLCRDADIPLVALGDEPIDIAIDGADEVDPQWSLIKGGGGALFREKAVAIAAHIFVVVITQRKCVERLGAFPLPVEVVPFSIAYVAHEIEALGASIALRRVESSGKAYVTDNGNAILDCRFETISGPALFDRMLREIHGVVATGLFVGLTSAVLVAQDDGSVEALGSPARAVLR